jgi:hypothetical protein
MVTQQKKKHKINKSHHKRYKTAGTVLSMSWGYSSLCDLLPHNRDTVSVKSGKDRVSIPSWVIHRVRFNKNVQKRTLAFKRGV